MEEHELEAVLAQVGVTDEKHMARLSKKMIRWHDSGMASRDIAVLAEEEEKEEESGGGSIMATIRLEGEAHHGMMEEEEASLMDEEDHREECSC